MTHKRDPKGAESGMQRINDATLYGADVVRELPSSASHAEFCAVSTIIRFGR